MAFCSINIPEMTSLVGALEKAVWYDLYSDRHAVSAQLSKALLSTSSMTPVDNVLTWAEDELVHLRRRLAMAKDIEASTPGVQKFAQFDDKDISQRTPEQAAADARTIADALKKGDPPLTEEQLKVLEKGAVDPYFAKELATQLPPEELAEVMNDMSPRQSSAPGSRADNFEPDVSPEYQRIVTALGEATGQASRGQGDLAMPEDYADKWLDVITAGDDNESGEASKLALIIGQGNYSKDFLVKITEGIVGHERDQDEGYWKGLATSSPNSFGGTTYMGASGLDNSQAYDPLASVLQSVARNPEAALSIFERSDRTNATVDGKDHEVSSMMDYLIKRRNWPTDDGKGAQDAILAAATPFEGGSTYSSVVASDARLTSESFKEEVKDRTEKPWYSQVIHGILDVVGLVPLVGELADGVNGIYYYAEGDVINGTLSMAALVPLGGQGATAGKWGRKILKGDEAAAALKNLHGAKLPDDLASVQLLAKADNLEPGVFKFNSIDELNAAANNAHPNLRYEYKDQHWTTNEFGDISGAGGVLRRESGGREPGLQRDIGNGPNAKDSDVGFHLIGDALGGPTNKLNVVPGNGKPIDDGLANLNQGEYASMERQLRKELDGYTEAGKTFPPADKVEIHVDVKYPPGAVSGARPERFIVHAKIWRDGRWVKRSWPEFYNK